MTFCCSKQLNHTFLLSSVTTDMYEVPDAVPPIHAVSSHVATDKDPSKFRSIFSDNLQPIATRGKKARGTLLVDIGCSSERAPSSVSYYNEISSGHMWSRNGRRRSSAEEFGRMFGSVRLGNV